MWNEFMEWVDEWGNPIPIPDEDEDEEDEYEEDEEDEDEEDDDDDEPTPGDEFLAKLATLVIGMPGYFLGTKVVAPAIKKRREKRNADKKNETS